MLTEPLCIVGAGGHAKVVLDALSTLDRFHVCNVFDDDPNKVGEHVGAFEITRTPSGELPCNNVHLAIGDCAARRKLTDYFLGKGCSFVSIVSRLAAVSENAHCEGGVFVAPAAVLAADCHVGANTIVNHGAVVDHDARVGGCCHIGPRAVLCGSVTVGNDVLIGAGAVVLPGVTVAEFAIVGAGAIVTHDVGRSAIVTGVPAKEKR